MYVVEVFLPFTSNEDDAFSRTHFEQVKLELTERWGGVTAFIRSPAEGVWKESNAVMSYDQIIIIEVMVETLDRVWWITYRHELKHRFHQDEILIRATETEKL